MLMYAGVEQPSKKSWAYDLWMNEGGGYLGRTFPVPGGLETWEVRVGPVRASEPEGRHWLEVETPTEIHSNEYWTRAEAAARGEVIMGLRTLGHFRACQRDAVTWMDPRLARPSKVQSMLRQLRDEGVLDA